VGGFHFIQASILDRNKHMTPIPSVFNITEYIFLENEMVKRSKLMERF